MPTFANAESAASVRTKINDAIDKVDGNAAITSVNIDSGSIDGTTIGAASAAAGSFTTVTASGDVTIADKIIHSGDTNTAIRFPAADTVTVETAGAERLRIDSSGRVGIGTSSPLAKLHVESAGGSGGRVLFGGSTTSAYSTNINVTDTGMEFWAQSNSRGLTFSTGSTQTERMRITSTGNVGIGTTTPTFTVGAGLEISQSVGAVLRLTDPDNTGSFDLQKIGNEAYVYQRANAAMIFGTNSAERMRITSTGNVGIGTTSPARQLSVYAASGDAYLQIANATTGAIFSDGFQLGVQSGTGDALLNNREATNMRLFTSGTERMRIDASGNLLLAGTGTPTSSAGNIVLYNGTAPTGNATDGVILYAEDVSASSELKVRDEAGNVTTLSPHNFDLIPEGPSEDMAWSYYSERDGKRINVDMLKAIRLLEQITGEKLVHIV